METFLRSKAHKILHYVLYIVGGFLALGTLLPAVSVGQFDDGAAFPYEIQGETYDEATEVVTTDLAKDIIKDDTKASKSILKRITDFFRLSGTSYDDPNSDAKATDYVKWILNMLLGLVSFLALAMIIFAFYLIFFSKGEDGVAKAKKILIGVGIALAIMGLSWFITSFFFDIFTTVTK